MNRYNHHSTTRLLRNFLALLTLVFVLGTVAHAGHDHNKEQQSRHQVCDYCAGFAHLGAAPSTTAILNVELLANTTPVTTQRTVPSKPIQTAAQPRAPPAR